MSSGTHSQMFYLTSVREALGEAFDGKGVKFARITMPMPHKQRRATK